MWNITLYVHKDIFYKYIYLNVHLLDFINCKSLWHHLTKSPVTQSPDIFFSNYIYFWLFIQIQDFHYFHYTNLLQKAINNSKSRFFLHFTRFLNLENNSYSNYSLNNPFSGFLVYSPDWVSITIVNFKIFFGSDSWRSHNIPDFVFRNESRQCLWGRIQNAGD